MLNDKTTKVRVNVSIASADWSFQPNQIVEIESKQARAWIASGIATSVPKATPLSTVDVFDELSAEEARRRPCTHCSRRASFVLRNKPYCPAHFRAEMES